MSVSLADPIRSVRISENWRGDHIPGLKPDFVAHSYVRAEARTYLRNNGNDNGLLSSVCQFSA